MNSNKADIHGARGGTCPHRDQIKNSVTVWLGLSKLFNVPYVFFSLNTTLLMYSTCFIKGDWCRFYR